MSLPRGELEVVGESERLARKITTGTSIVGRSLWSIAWRRLRKDKVAMAAGVVIILLVLIAIFADQLSALYGQNYLVHHSVGVGSLLDPATNFRRVPSAASVRATGSESARCSARTSWPS
jgi:hypothetical protein